MPLYPIFKSSCFACLSMLPSIDEVPLTVVLSLIKVKDEEVLIPFQELKGQIFMLFARKSKNTESSSLNVRAGQVGLYET